MQSTSKLADYKLHSVSRYAGVHFIYGTSAADTTRSATIFGLMTFAFSGKLRGFGYQIKYRQNNEG